ncbi:hypothetical protein [Bradyrhizobium iriomotense]|uniref:Uncharacterized protein n=1 Tax=Bradyrhizobium iriomotense TaxID=441950 RepID=A0ABQ6B7S2_9BRAD|nr:hypothetical protein [Bradyrhizobium iriomotense]GLR89449.1 hypothetical protein GCM10007857_61620 [Bradyrhizobium iriomotense]
MSSLWEFISRKRNREVLGWLGGGLVVAATGLWAAIVYFFPPQKSVEPRPASVQADCGGVAIGGSVFGASITGGNTTNSDCSSKPK